MCWKNPLADWFTLRFNVTVTGQGDVRLWKNWENSHGILDLTWKKKTKEKALGCQKVYCVKVQIHKKDVIKIVHVESLLNRALGVLACFRARIRVLCLRASYHACLACLALTYSPFCLIIYFVCINQGFAVKRKLLMIHANLS